MNPKYAFIIRYLDHVNARKSLSKSGTNLPGHWCHGFWNLASFIFEIDNHWVQQKLSIHCHNRPCSAGRKHKFESTTWEQPADCYNIMTTFPAIMLRTLLTEWTHGHHTLHTTSKHIWQIVNTKEVCCVPVKYSHIHTLVFFVVQAHHIVGKHDSKHCWDIYIYLYLKTYFLSQLLVFVYSWIL